MSAAARLGCRLCARATGGYGMLDTPVNLHHPRTHVGAGRRAHDSEIIPLCPQHHQLGRYAIHTMGRKAFERHWRVTEAELTAETKRLVRERFGIELQGGGET